MISALRRGQALLVRAVLLAIFFSTLRLTESPPFWYDEGWYVQTSANLATVGIDGIQLAPGYIKHISMLTVGYPVIYPMAFWMKAFGTGVVSARSLMVVFMLLLLAGAYHLIKRLRGSGHALVAFFLLATFPPFYGNGKSVLGEVPGMLYLVLFLICFYAAKRSPSKKEFWLVLAGVAGGLCVATKPLFLLLLPALLVGVVIEKKRGLLSAKEILIGVVSVIVPIIIWLIVQFGAGESISNILTFYANPYAEQSLVAMLATNVAHVFTDVSTLFTLGIMLVWAVALVINRLRHHKASAEEVIAFIFAVLVALAFLRIGSVYRYLFPTQVLALMFWPASVTTIASALRARYGRERLLKRASYVLTMLVILLGLYQLAFHSWVADSYSSKKTAFWQEYFEKLPQTTSVYFYNAPEVVPFIHGRNYYQSLLTPASRPTGTEQLDVIKAGKPDKIIIETAKYEPLKAELFKLYSVDQTAYKYSILKRK